MNAAQHTGKPCYWCRRTLLPPMGRDQHPLSATTDHVRSRPECMSKSEYMHKRNKVPACYECNQRRSREWIARYQAGLVIRTPFAEKDTAKWHKRREKFKAIREKERTGHLYDNRPGVKVTVAPELSEAWG